MYEYLIYNQIKRYAGVKKSFHVPGHKAREDFRAKFPDAEIDVTELSYSDNLFCPSGVIARAQTDLAAITGARKSYILTDGSTSGVLTMIYAASRRGGKLIVPKNCHESVWNACKIFKIEPVTVGGDRKDGLITPPDPKEIARLADDAEVIGMIATSPDYYGNISPLARYAEILHARGKLLLVDGAHGAHLCFEPEKRGYAGVYADIWVDGAHKSLPVLTQGALLNVSNPELIPAAEDGLNIFRTTSPSYPIMASVEYGYKYLANNPEKISAAKRALKGLKEKISPVKLGFSDDWTKIALDFAEVGISSHKVAAELEKEGIYCELSDGRRLLFYISAAVEQSDIDGLAEAVTRIIKCKKLAGSYRPAPEIPACPRVVPYLSALALPREYAPFNEAAGRICAVNCGITPPCIPVILAGERITEAAAGVLKEAESVFGLTDGKIPVVKGL